MKLFFSFLFILTFTVSAQEKKANGTKQLILQPGEKLPPPNGLPGVMTKEANPTPPVSPTPAPAPAEDPAKLVSDFFELLGKAQIDEAYLALTKNSRIVEKPEDLRLLKLKTKEAI